jgi:phosphatidylserine/phosphatidylglycerophosphate/cardiolipin synthase-like enzyme
LYVKGADVNIYLGTHAGKSLKFELANATKEIKIVSPYLSPDFVKRLIDFENEGLNVTLITSNDVKTNNYSDFGIYDLIKQRKHKDDKKAEKRSKGIGISIVVFILSVAFLLVNSPIGIFGTIVAAVLFFSNYSTVIYSYTYHPTLHKLKVYKYDDLDRITKNSTFFIHSKIFVIDNKVAFLGSLNYTKSGFQYNYESGIRIKNLDMVKEISKEIDKIYYGKVGPKDKRLYEIDIDEWGKSIYPEYSH